MEHLVHLYLIIDYRYVFIAILLLVFVSPFCFLFCSLHLLLTWYYIWIPFFFACIFISDFWFVVTMKCIDCFSAKHLLSPSNPNHSLLVKVFLFVALFLSSFKTCHFLLAYRFSTVKSVPHLMGVPLYITSCFFLTTFKWISSIFNYCHFHYNVSWCGPFWFILFGTLSPGQMSVSFPRLGKFLAIQRRYLPFPSFFSFWDPWCKF